MSMALRKLSMLALVFLLALVGCQDANNESGQQKNEDVTYQVTEENEHPEAEFENEPVSSYWFPEDLLAWEFDEDEDAKYNVSQVSLQERVDESKLQAVNDTQNFDTEVVALSIMNPTTSGNLPHGENSFDTNTFSYWQYIDKLVYWGGSAAEGLIVPPSPDVTNASHLNGVPVLGTVFFPPVDFSGKLEWLDDFLTVDEDGNFPMVDKLIEVANTYGFDGWFINQETQSTEDEPLTKEHADLMLAFIEQFKADSEGQLEIMYYDAMTVDGEVAWQNALNEKNAAFLVDEKGEGLADSMFLNFWWTTDSLADEDLLKSSKEYAEEVGIDPYQLFAGIDVQANGFSTPVKWDLFEEKDGKTYTSLGLYAADWAYSSSGSLDDYLMNENLFWVNNASDPRETSEEIPTSWPGISRYVVEKSALTTLPFTTNFNLGNGYNFFIDGEKVSELDWHNRGVSDIMPTYRWIFDHEGENELEATIDYADAYYGGNSIKLRGQMEKDATSTMTLYRSDLPISEDTFVKTVVKASDATKVNLVLTLDNNEEEVIETDDEISDEWSTLNFDISDFEDHAIRQIALDITSEEDASSYEFNLGNLTIADEETLDTTSVTEVVSEGEDFDEEAMLTGVRLSWEVDEAAHHYEVYRINEDGSKSLLSITKASNYYVNALPRTDETNKSTFEVVPVNQFLERGQSAETTIEWPDNSIPKAAFVASKTLIQPGDSVTFTSESSNNTEELVWSFEGSDLAETTEEEPTVTFDDEGVYSVTLTAKNDKGEDSVTREDLIVVSKDAPKDLDVLSLDKPTEATSYTNDNEAPECAVDGDDSTKWCAIGDGPHEITVDLEESKLISEVELGHAEFGGESPDMNTKGYKIYVSEDGTDFTEVTHVTKNEGEITVDTFAPVEARYVKLSVIKPTQGSDSAARIYNFEVRGQK